MPPATKTVDIKYAPLPKQSVFHTSEAKYRLYIGAWRAGKSLAGCIEALKQSILHPGNIGLIGRKDFTDLRDTTIKTFLDICPVELIKIYNKTEHHVILKNGSEVYFRELKDRSGLGSLELGWFYIDEAEEVAEEVYLYLKGRLSSQKTKRHCGWLTSNPPNTDHWLYRHFEKKETLDGELIHASTYENQKNLPAGYIDGLEMMPESWRKKYLMGQWGFTPDGEPFYQGFKESMHVKDLSNFKPSRIYRGWDYGFHHPACVFSAFDDQGRWLVLREMLGDKIIVGQFRDEVLRRCVEWYPLCKDWVDYGDPAGEQKNDKSEKTSVEILADGGVFVTSKASTYRERKEIIEQKLSTLIQGTPALIVNACCKTIIDGFLGGYHYATRRQGQGFNPRIHEVPYRDGFFEHCLSGETKVRTLDGWHCIKDLVGKEFITYAYDSMSKRLVPAKARDCRKTQENVALWKLQMDTGELVATPEHLIMLRDGSYRMLKDLKPMDELMPFYEAHRNKNKTGHKTIALNDGSVVDEHRYIYTWFNGHLREGHHIHHKDENPGNNYPGNLEQQTKEFHMAGVYAKMRSHMTQKMMKLGSLNPWTEESRKKVGFWAKKHAEESRIEMKCEICGNVFMGKTFGVRQRYCNKKCLWRASGLRRRLGTARPYRCKKNCLNCLKEFEGMSMSKYCSIACRGRYKNKQKNLELVNHKVLSVDFWGYGDTYNLEVDTYHNFPANGVMVHNCLNSLEYMAVNLFSGAGTKQDSTDVTVRTIGDMKDIKIEYDEEETNHSNYRLVTQGSYEE